MGTGGKTLRLPRLIPGEQTGVLITAGQSNLGNTLTDTHTPVNGEKIDNLNIFDGGVYAAADPLLGSDVAFGGGHLATRFADQLITNGKYDRVVIVPIAINGTLLSEWEPSGNLHQLFEVAFHRCAEHGLPVTGVLWAQGESDGLHGRPQAQYEAGFAAMIASIRAAGHSEKWILAKSTYASGAAYPAIQAALLASANGSDILTGPDTDSLTGANREDGTHFSATGAINATALWVESITALL